MRLLSVTDGTSNTLLIGEKFVRPKSMQGKNEDRSVYDGNNLNNFRRFLGVHPLAAPTGEYPIIGDPMQQANFTDPSTGITVSPNQCFGSNHEGVCQFVFCDGSVRAVPLNHTLLVLSYLALPADGQAINVDF